MRRNYMSLWLVTEYIQPCSSLCYMYSVPTELNFWLSPSAKQWQSPCYMLLHVMIGLLEKQSG